MASFVPPCSCTTCRRRSGAVVEQEGPSASDVFNHEHRPDLGHRPDTSWVGTIGTGEYHPAVEPIASRSVPETHPLSAVSQVVDPPTIAIDPRDLPAVSTLRPDRAGLASTRPAQTVPTQPRPAPVPDPDLQEIIEQATAEVESLRAQVAAEKGEAERFRQLWKKATGQLNAARTQDFYQGVSDKLLEKNTRGLRYDIRAFAQNHFQRVGLERAPPRDPPSKSHTLLHRDRHSASKGSDKPVETYANYMNQAVQSSSLKGLKAPSLVEMFLWRVIVGEIFGRYRWTDDKAGIPFYQLRTRLLAEAGRAQPAGAANSLEPDSLRELQLWNASTTRLVLKTGSDPSTIDALVARMTKRIRASTVTFVKPENPAGHDNALDKILRDAIEFDKEINKQVAYIEWDFKDGDSLRFKRATMELQGGEVEPKEGAPVHFVIAPALVKRGTSTAEDFEKARVVVPMVVSCAFDDGN